MSNENDYTGQLGKGPTDADTENHNRPLFFSDDGDNGSDEQMRDINLLDDDNSDGDGPAPATHDSISKLMTSQNSKRLDPASVTSTRILPSGSYSETEKDEGDDSVGNPIDDGDDRIRKESGAISGDEDKGDENDGNKATVAKKPVNSRRRPVLIESDEE